ncbi:MAG: lamin tail domain-containing protein [Verrucomicrobiota bacterium]|nr:lamin tail domain-containing protein [Verrucomicrobiota bacterium]
MLILLSRDEAWIVVIMEVSLNRIAGVLLILLLNCLPTSHAQANGVLREVYLGIPGNSISELTNSPTFPDSPSFESVEPLFEAPENIEESFGTRMRALITAPMTGNYTFWISSDDNGALFLSTDENPGTRRQIASVSSWTASREWNKEPSQQSAPIPLQAGKKYYIEALQKEGGGGDNLAVRWQLPNTLIEEPIPGNRLQPYGLGPPLITQQPGNQTVVEGAHASFTVRLSRNLGASFQWFRGNTIINGATNSTYSFGPVALIDDQATFRCAIANSSGSTNSVTATLTVLADTTPPTINTVGSLGDPNVIFVVFSEPVEAATALNAQNYSISGGIGVTRAAFGTDPRTVVLTTAANIPLGQTQTLTVNNVRDRASAPNTIASNSERTFIVQVSPIDISYLGLPREPLGPSTRRAGVIISEIMYHPTNRVDGKNLEFIEIYNTQPWFEELGGWRLSGDIAYTFPTNTVLPSRGYIIVAANPADFKSVYTSATNVVGPFANADTLPNSGGTVRLRNSQGAIFFEMEYSDQPPYPPAADGAGHSLVLLRPSYGAGDARAWGASSQLGGTPGTVDPTLLSPYRSVVINEFLAHTDLPQVDFIELYNYGASSVNLAGCILSDDTELPRFVIPAGTVIPAGGFLAFTETELGFALSSAGETIFFKDPQSRVIEALNFGAQENGVSSGRVPDGAPSVTRLASPTLAASNSSPRQDAIIINEIMFDPMSNDPNDEYVELFNRSNNSIDLSGWRLRDAVSFTFPTNTIIPANGYLVIAGNPARLRTNYPNLTLANTIGGFEGALGNGGERIELTMPDKVFSTNNSGVVVSDTIHIPIDEVTYGPGGRWGSWARGGGSSLELRDPRADNRLAPNWADSDESNKSPWVTVEATGVMDNGWADANQLHVTLLGAGEALIDNVEVIPAGSGNVISNGTFESGSNEWIAQGNHNQTSLETSQGFNSSRSLHIRTVGQGDTGANRIRTQLSTTLQPGTTVTLRARVRWLKGNPNLLLRLRGNWLEAPGFILAASNLGTPGAINSAVAQNVGPAISAVRHDPPLPNAGQAVRVVAQVQDPDRLAYLTLNYRLDPATNFTIVPMVNNGAGLYSALLPGHPAGTLAAFYIEGLDNHQTPASSRFPNDAPVRECLIRWGEPAAPGWLGTYRFWISQTNINRWRTEEKMSNRPKDITFIYGSHRVIYNAGGWFHGSPYHSPSYDSPDGSQCDYDLGFPEDDLLLGETDINLFRPGNGGGDGTAQTELHGYWFGAQFGIPFLYHRPVFVFVNGNRRETVFHDAQQPNGDFINQWYPDDADGDLHKIQLGFEFGNTVTGANEAGFSVVGADLNRYTTTGGVMKQARYRQTWQRRSSTVQELNDFTGIYDLVNTVLTNAPIGSQAYETALTNLVDVEEWFKVHVTQHLYNNPDSFSYGGGQNAFAYKPVEDTWKLLLWDIDFAFGGNPEDPNLFGIGGAEHGPRNDHPSFNRIYWQALLEAANTFMTPERSNPILDARYNGMRSGGADVGSADWIKDFIQTRRNFILTQAAAANTTFAILSNNGQPFSTNRNLVTLTGRAPLEMRTLLVNGVAYPITWTTRTTWSVRLPLGVGLNTLQFTGIDSRGKLLSSVNGTLNVTFTGSLDRAEDSIVINEIMYNPVAPGSSYVEIYNRSQFNVFDLTSWRLNGASFLFPNGTLIEPGAYILLVRDLFSFRSAYGVNLPVIGEFSGELSNEGETLSLYDAATNLIDQVRFDNDLPWPSGADGGGASLQLIDAAEDNNRVANWGVITNAPNTGSVSLVKINDVWRYNQTANFSTLDWVAPGFNDADWSSGAGLLYVEEAALPAPKNTPLTLGRTAYYFRKKFTFDGTRAGAVLKLSTVLDDGAVIYLNGKELLRIGMPPGDYGATTPANRSVGDAAYEGPSILPAGDLVVGENTIAVTARQAGAGSSDIVFGMTLDVEYNSVASSTPGFVNSTRDDIPAFPKLWLNELLSTNLTGITDRFNEREPWVELYNGGTNSIDLSGYFLANNFTNLTQWPFPANATIAPGQFLVVFLDGETSESNSSEFHANFRVPVESGSILLTRGSGFETIVDYLSYSITVPGRSSGSYPDGAVSGRRQFPVVTAGQPNDPTFPPVEIRINEWMADNLNSLADPTDGGFEDWFELYNPTTNDVNLTGYALADNLTNSTQSVIPMGTIIPARGFLLVWADSENPAGATDLHVNFGLSKSGDTIALFAPDRSLVDSVTFAAQSTDVTQGRFPDGSQTIQTLTNITPRASNSPLVASNTAPLLQPIANRSISEGQQFSIIAEGSDSDLPAQQLTYSLEPGAPSGMLINASSGLLTWTPAEVDGPGVFTITIRVTDNGSPAMSSTTSVTLTVLEMNNPPTVQPINGATIVEGTLFTETVSATDSDSGNQVLQFSLDPGAPSGLSINPSTGVMSWIPTESQGPANYTVTVRVTDNGDPEMSASQNFTIFVSEVNSPPELTFPPEHTIYVGSEFTLQMQGTDPDLPEQLMTYSLVNAPAGASIDASTGMFVWTPSAADIGTNSFSVRLRDSGSPQNFVEETLTIIVAADLKAAIVRNDNNITISCVGVAGRTYRLESRADLAAADWEADGEDVTATNSTVIFNRTLGSSDRFYRIVESP